MRREGRAGGGLFSVGAGWGTPAGEIYEESDGNALLFVAPSRLELVGKEGYSGGLRHWIPPGGFELELLEAVPESATRSFPRERPTCSWVVSG